MALQAPRLDNQLTRIRAVVEPLCLAHQVELVEVVWATAQVLRVTIERRSAEDPTGKNGWGVSLEDCADLSRDLSNQLDADDFIPQAYSLEVSSPGLERTLLSVEDYRRFQGLAAKVKLSKPSQDGQRLLRGTLVGVSGVGVSGSSGDAQIEMSVDGHSHKFPFSSVSAAHLVFVMPTAKKSEKVSTGKKDSPKKSPSPSAVRKATRS